MSVEGPDASRAVEIDHELRGLYTRMAELHGERADMAGSLSASSLNGAGGELGWLADGYAAATESLPDLGFTERQIKEGVPALERVQEVLAPLAVWLETRASAGHQHEVIVEPSVRKIGLMGNKRWPGLIPRFNRLQGEADQTIVWPEIWAQLDDKHPSHDAVSADDPLSLFSVAILLGDIHDPIGVQGVANRHKDPGGVYADCRADEQRLLLATEKLAHAAKGRTIEGVTIGQVVAINNTHRHAGQPFLSTDIATRLTHYDDWRAAGDNKPTWTPAVRAIGRRQELGASDVEAIEEAVVIRRVLRLDFSK